jgi:integrase
MSQQRITMTTLVRHYLRQRRSLGFELETNGLVLMDFARFADRSKHRGPLTNELLLRWATERDDHSARYRAERLSIIRGFARYLAARDGRSEVPESRLLSSGYRRHQPHIYTDRQLRQLLRATAQLSPVYRLRPKTYTTLFGLLASTGLRISEALELQIGDVDLEAGILHIRQTKFQKSRLVPMHPTVSRVVKRYAALRDRDPTCRSSSTFFVGRDGRSLPYNTVRCTFRRLCRKLRWQSNGALPLPRIHDLRHSFACRRLLRWYQAGVNVDHAIAALSTYLGHGKVTDTYWYLSGTGELLSVAGRKFERFATLGGRQS